MKARNPKGKSNTICGENPFVIHLYKCAGRRSNQSNNRDSNKRDTSAQILQVNQLQQQYNMFTASSLLPQTQPAGTGEQITLIMYRFILNCYMCM